MKKFILVTTLFFIFNILFSNEIAKSHTRLLDFGRDEERAVEHADERRIEFEDNLPHDLRELFEDSFIGNDHSNLIWTNKMLEKIRLEDVNNASPSDHLITLENVILFDMFFQYAVVTEEPKFIYINIKPEQLGYENNNSWDHIDNPNFISDSHYEQLKSYFTSTYYNGYIIGDLVSSNTDTVDGDRLCLKLLVPSGTKIIPTIDTTIILERNVALSNNNFFITIENGRQIITADSNLLDRPQMDSIVSFNTQLLNDTLREHLELPSMRNIITFNVQNLITSSTINRANQIIDNYTQNLPKEILIDIYNAPVVNERYFNIIFTDEIIDDNENVPGLYDPEINTLFLVPSHRSLMDAPEEGVLTANTYLQASMHEIGHALDFLVLGNSIYFWSEEDVRFGELFEQDRYKFDDSTSFIIDGQGTYYGSTDISEFFCEVFAAMYSHEEQIRINIWNQMPETCQYIADVIGG